MSGDVRRGLRSGQVGGALAVVHWRWCTTCGGMAQLADKWVCVPATDRLTDSGTPLESTSKGAPADAKPHSSQIGKR